MKDDTIDVFGRAMLYIYQARLENLGFKGELKAVRVKGQGSEQEMEAG